VNFFFIPNSFPNARFYQKSCIRNGPRFGVQVTRGRDEEHGGVEAALVHGRRVDRPPRRAPGAARIELDVGIERQHAEVGFPDAGHGRGRRAVGAATDERTD